MNRVRFLRLKALIFPLYDRFRTLLILLPRAQMSNVMEKLTVRTLLLNISLDYDGV